MHNEYRISVMAIEDPARRFDDLAVAGSLELLRSTSALRMLGQLPDVPENPLYQFCRRCGVFKRDVVGNGIQVGHRRLGPDYLSHLERRARAWACVNTRPSATACSPRAIPSSKVMRCCMSS